MKLFLASFITLGYTTMLFGAYDIKLAVYKNAKNLHASIAKIENVNYKKRIVIERRNHLYYAHAVIASQKEAHNALHVYKKVFKDAFISNKQVALPQLKPATPKKEPTVQKVQDIRKTKSQIQDEQSVQPQSQPIPQSPVATVEKKIEEPKKKPLLDAQALLANKTVYLCYETGPEHLKNRLVKMDFKEQNVTYDPMKKTSASIAIPCTFDKNALVMDFSGVKVAHYVTQQTSDYLLAESIHNGMPDNKVRYYFDKERAQAFATRR